MTDLYLVATIGDRADLVPKFFQYYRNAGISRFIIILHGARPQSNELKELQALCRQQGITPAFTWSGPFSETRRIETEQDFIQKLCTDDDWIVYADIDEFIEFTCSPDQLIQFAKAEGASYFTSQLLDRVHPEGKLVPVTGQCLDDTYPMCSPITKHLLCACNDKVALARSTERVGFGHHYTIGDLPVAWHEGHQSTGKAASLFLTTHHFKWGPSAAIPHGAPYNQEMEQWHLQYQRMARKLINANQIVLSGDLNLTPRTAVKLGI